MKVWKLIRDWWAKTHSPGQNILHERQHKAARRAQIGDDLKNLSAQLRKSRQLEHDYAHGRAARRGNQSWENATTAVAQADRFRSAQHLAKRKKQPKGKPA